MAIGWRPIDLYAGFLPFGHGLGMQIALSDPAFMGLQGLAPFPDTDVAGFPYDADETEQRIAAGDERAGTRAQMAAAWGREAVNGSFRTWEDLRFLRKHWEGPLVLKGIMCLEVRRLFLPLLRCKSIVLMPPQDAEIALTEGVDGIIVSNHGGRQIDGSISALLALERIMTSPKVRAAQALGTLTVLMDSGVRSGADVFRALALGAQAVLRTSHLHPSFCYCVLNLACWL